MQKLLQFRLFDVALKHRYFSGVCMVEQERGYVLCHSFHVKSADRLSAA